MIVEFPVTLRLFTSTIKLRIEATNESDPWRGPACIWGPASITTCQQTTLCYFIQKSSTSVYQYQYFVYFHNALKHWNIPNE